MQHVVVAVAVALYVLIGFGFYALIPSCDPGKYLRSRRYGRPNQFCFDPDRPRWHGIMVVAFWLPMQIALAFVCLSGLLLDWVIDWVRFIEWEWLWK